MRPKSESMKESRRRILGLYMSGGCAGPGWGNPGYFSVVYEVTYEDGTSRIEPGRACREYGEGYAALRALYAAYLRKAEACKGKGKCS